MYKQKPVDKTIEKEWKVTIIFSIITIFRVNFQEEKSYHFCRLNFVYLNTVIHHEFLDAAHIHVRKKIAYLSDAKWNLHDFKCR